MPNSTTELNVIGEVKVDVNHCLLATEATDYREIRVVYSHPQALAQCRDFLMRNNLEPRPYYDTAGALPRARLSRQAICADLRDLRFLRWVRCLMIPLCLRAFVFAM